MSKASPKFIYILYYIKETSTFGKGLTNQTKPNPNQTRHPCTELCRTKRIKKKYI